MKTAFKVFNNIIQDLFWIIETFKGFCKVKTPNCKKWLILYWNILLCYTDIKTGKVPDPYSFGKHGCKTYKEFLIPVLLELYTEIVLLQFLWCLYHNNTETWYRFSFMCNLLLDFFILNVDDNFFNWNRKIYYFQ